METLVFLWWFWLHHHNSEYKCWILGHFNNTLITYTVTYLYVLDFSLAYYKKDFFVPWSIFLRHVITECGWQWSFCISLHITIILWIVMKWLLELPVIPVFHLKTNPGWVFSDARWRFSFSGFRLWIWTWGKRKACYSMAALSAEHAGDEVFVYGYEAKPTAAN